MSLNIKVFNDSEFARLPKAKVIKCLEKLFFQQKIKKANVNVIFVDDKIIKDLNKEYLDHDFETDVITFSYSESEIDGEIYISADTAELQAKEYGVSLTNELLRLSIHGALHLTGFNDATDDERAKMKELEDKYLKL